MSGPILPRAANITFEVLGDVVTARNPEGRGSFFTARANIGGTIYKITHSDPNHIYDKDTAEIQLNKMIDKIIILHTRYAYEDVDMIEFNDQNQNIQRTYKNPPKHGREDQPYEKNYDFQFDAQLNKAKSKLRSLDDPDSDKYKQTENRIERIKKTKELYQHLIAAGVNLEAQRGDSFSLEKAKEAPERREARGEPFTEPLELEEEEENPPERAPTALPIREEGERTVKAADIHRVHRSRKRSKTASEIPERAPTAHLLRRMERLEGIVNELKLEIERNPSARVEQAELEEGARILKDLRAEFSKQETLLEEAQSKLAVTEKRIRETETLYENEYERAERSEKSMAKLGGKLEELQQDLDVMRKTSTELEATLERWKLEQKELREKIGATEAKLQGFTKENKRLQESNIAFVEERKALAAEIRNLKQELLRGVEPSGKGIAAESASRLAQNEEPSLETLLAELREIKAFYQKQAEEEIPSSQFLKDQEDLARKAEELGRLQRENEALKTRVNELGTDNSVLRSATDEVEQLRASVNEKTKQAEQAIAARGLLEARVKEAQARAEQLEEASQKQLGEHKAIVGELEKKLEGSAAQAQKTALELRALGSRTDQAEARAQKLETGTLETLEKHNARVLELEKAVAEQKEKAEAAVKKAERAAEERTQAEGRLQEAEARAKEVETRNLELQRTSNLNRDARVAQLEKALEERTAQVQELEHSVARSLDAATAPVGPAPVEVEQLREELASREARVEELLGALEAKTREAELSRTRVINEAEKAHQRQMEDATGAIDQLKRENERLRQARAARPAEDVQPAVDESVKEELEEAKGALRAARSRINALEKTNEELNARVENAQDLQTDFDAQKANTDKQRARLIEVQTRLKELEGERSETGQWMEQLQEQQRKAKSAEQDALRTAEEQKRTIEELQAKIKALETERQALERYFSAHPDLAIQIANGLNAQEQ